MMLHRPSNVLAIVALLFLFEAGSSQAALISSTVNQDGHKVFVGGGAASKVGTFTFPRGYSQYTDILFRGWVDLAGTAVGPATPILVFAAYDPLAPDSSFLNGPVVPTSLRVHNNTDPATFGIDERVVGWEPLSASEGMAIANLVNQDPLGRIDAWLYSPSITDFSTPDMVELLTFNGQEWVIESVVLTSTLSFQAVPEPTSAMILFGVLMSASVFHGRVKRS